MKARIALIIGVLILYYSLVYVVINESHKNHLKNWEEQPCLK